MFKEILVPLGFVMKGSLFIRVTNEEIIQTVNIFKLSPVDFTLNIGIFPFSGENDKRLLKEGGYRLYHFVEPGEFEYIPQNLQSIKNELEKCVVQFKREILSIFENVQTEKDLLIFEEEFEKKHYSKIIITSENKLFINLKLRQYSEALNVVEAFRSHNISSIMESHRDLFNNEDEFQLFLNEELQEFNAFKNAIESNDIDFLDKIVQTNIDNTITVLKNYGFKF